MQKKAMTPAVSGAPARSSKIKWRLELGWQVAVDLETDANFNQNGCRPSHDLLPFGPGSIMIERKRPLPQVPFGCILSMGAADRQEKRISAGSLHLDLPSTLNMA